MKENRLSVEDAARLMGVTGQFIRIGLQKERLPFGYAVKRDKSWTYYISPVLFARYTGIVVDGVPEEAVNRPLEEETHPAEEVLPRIQNEEQLKKVQSIMQKLKITEQELMEAVIAGR